MRSIENPGLNSPGLSRLCLTMTKNQTSRHALKASLEIQVAKRNTAKLDEKVDFITNK